MGLHICSVDIAFTVHPFNVKKLIHIRILLLSHDILSGSDIESCIKIDKPLVGYIFSNIL